jgi:hypothetical protein
MIRIETNGNEWANWAHDQLRAEMTIANSCYERLKLQQRLVSWLVLAMRGTLTGQVKNLLLSECNTVVAYYDVLRKGRGTPPVPEHTTVEGSALTGNRPQLPVAVAGYRYKLQTTGTALGSKSHQCSEAVMFLIISLLRILTQKICSL